MKKRGFFLVLVSLMLFAGPTLWAQGRFGKDRDLGDGFQFRAVFAVEFIEVRRMLEEVGVQFFVVQGQVRFDVIREFDDFQVDAFLGQERLDFVEDFAVRYGRSADGDRRVLGRRAAGSGITAAAGSQESDGQQGRSGEKREFLEIFHEDSS